MNEHMYFSKPLNQGVEHCGSALRTELVLAELPSPDTKRWVMRRKAAVVGAVRNGLLSVDEACQRYKLSIEEFVSWQRLIEDHGLPGLRATRIQLYRGKNTSS